MIKSKINYETDPVLIEKIIETIDRHIIDENKTFISMTYAYELLLENKVFKSTDNVNLKNILDSGLIPHANQTNSKHRQWRIPLSEAGRKELEKSKKRRIVKKQVNFNPPSNLSPKIQSSNIQPSWYSGLDQRQKLGFKRLMFIVVIALIVLIVNVLPDNRSELVKELDRRYTGQEWTDYTYEYFNDQYGPGRPLNYHDQYWIYYYPKGDFSISVSKKNNRILEFSQGKE